MGDESLLETWIPPSKIPELVASSNTVSLGIVKKIYVQQNDILKNVFPFQQEASGSKSKSEFDNADESVLRKIIYE
jgi:hypothetical protein